MSAPSPDAAAIKGFAAVIPAGGVGSRLWPLSSPDRPKFLLDLLGEGRTLLQATVDRVEPLAEFTMVVTGVRHVAAVGEQLPTLTESDLVAEPSPRDSMAAIALAAAILERRHGPIVMGSFAADQVIRKPLAFEAAVREAVEVARTGKIVTIGIEPTGPSEAFGYIEAGEGLGVTARDVAAFTEKPDAHTAAAFIATGRYFWNAGMFVMRTDVLLGHLERLQPAIAAGVTALADAWDGPGRDDALAQWWPTITKIAIDHAIAEPVAAQGGVAVVPADLDWNDVGDFDSLASMLTPRADGVVAVDRGDVTAVRDAPRAVVVGGSRPVVIIGIPDAVVVDSGDALLVTTRAAAQQVKEASNMVANQRL
ncbi:mannose-1-phosphate guanylyltransferase [Demequina sp. TTPB684]|uniref:mannose-1-phosphate guanylyltransferase n=1 Tax=unclassified Demequina TaxID=2620311 RepID=UPI001CF2F4CA|nr:MULTISPECIES: mannose-1-phosphate guanylyltransferase [unclassified Demequina]MCB2411699.1 mannose-1-phosphate guanylyltransferase [Demequina sp. TTPB684]UPU87277.1 mannose-1-phosphate guanylyltransferase [Demequina sp. TMPB413]